MSNVETLFIIVMFVLIFLILGIFQNTLYSTFSSISAPENVKLILIGMSILVLFAPILASLKKGG